MKLEKIEGPIYHVRCCKCGDVVHVDRVMIDVEGEAYKSYYCERCL